MSSYTRPLQKISAELEASTFDPKIYQGFFVYILWGDDPEIPVYVGQTKNILHRLSTHMRDRTKRKLTNRIQVLRCRDRREMDSTESKLIGEYRPVLNKALPPEGCSIDIRVAALRHARRVRLQAAAMREDGAA